jgi:hypothetical protein
VKTDQSDLAFILDCTGSMQRYINSVRDHIFGICDMIRGEEGLGGPDDLRVAVSTYNTVSFLLIMRLLVTSSSLATGLHSHQIVNYRDHPPQDNTYVTKFHPFTSDIPEVQNYLKGLHGE